MSKKQKTEKRKAIERIEGLNNICEVCGKSCNTNRKLHLLIPESLGGKYTEDNLRLFCSLCHSRYHIMFERLALEHIFNATKGKFFHNSFKKLKDLIGAGK